MVEVMKTSKVSQKGWVVIPKEIRDELGIKPGDEMRFVIMPDSSGHGTKLRLIKISADMPDKTMGKYKPKPGERSLLDELMDEKRRELERDERRLARLKKSRRRAG